MVNAEVPQVIVMPNKALLLLKAFMQGTRRTTSPALPALSLNSISNKIKLETVDGLNKLIHWDGKEHIAPPILPHVMAFPLHMSLLLHEAFPFSVKGLVHIRNVITQYRPTKVGELLDIGCYLHHLTEHAKGWAFTLVTKVEVNGELVWESSSTYLSRDQQKLPITSPSRTDESIKPAVNIQKLKFHSRDGWRYAKVSGDFNPIHLHKFTANLFGFKTQIAHGMFSKAKCLAAMAKQNKSYNWDIATSVDVTFKRPLMLPANVNLCIESLSDQQTNFCLYNTQGNTHLTAAMTLL